MQLDIQELTIIIHGLDQVPDNQTKDFIGNIRAFLMHLHQRPWKFKALLTSQLQDEFKLEDIPSIEYDKERKGLIMHIDCSIPC